MSIVFFDVDHTIIRHSTARFFISCAVKRKILPLRLLLYFPYYFCKYRTGFLKAAFFNNTFPIIEGKSVEDIQECAIDALEKHVINDLYPAAIDLIKSEKKQGNIVVLATSSVDLFIEPLANFLEVDFIASRLEFYQGKSTGRFLGKPAFGEEKCRRVREYAEKQGIPLSECSFYSDSIHDLPLLKEIGTPYVVRPDLKLRKIVRKLKWKVIHFDRH